MVWTTSLFNIEKMTSNNTPDAVRGHLIVVEGLDRSGKTTQCQLLCEDIRGIDREVKYVKFPDRTTTTGQMINSYLQGQSNQSDQAIHLLFSANRWEAVQEISQLLKSGTTVVIDRYSFSGAVYSAAKENPAMSLEWCWNPEIGLPSPDLVLFLDISSEDAAKRGGYGEERYEKEEMQAKVRTLFKQLFSQIEQLNVKVVNAGQSLQDVADDIWKAYEALQKDHSPSQDISHLRSLVPAGATSILSHLHYHR